MNSLLHRHPQNEQHRLSVDPLDTPPVQARKDWLPLSRRIGPEPPAPPRNISPGSSVTADPGECVPTSGPETGIPVGQVGGGVPPDRNDPSSYPRGAKLPAPFPVAQAAPVSAAFDATQEYCTPNVVFFWKPPSCFSQ